MIIHKIKTKGENKKILFLQRGKNQRVAFVPAAYVPTLVEEGMERTEKHSREILLEE